MAEKYQNEEHQKPVGKMSPEELNSLSGKLLLEKRLKKKIREMTHKNFISRIFYRRFVVQ